MEVALRESVKVVGKGKEYQICELKCLIKEENMKVQGSTNRRAPG